MEAGTSLEPLAEFDPGFDIESRNAWSGPLLAAFLDALMIECAASGLCVFEPYGTPKQFRSK